MVELFSKSSRVEGRALVARRSERNFPAFKSLEGLGTCDRSPHSSNASAERIPFFTSCGRWLKTVGACFFLNGHGESHHLPCMTKTPGKAAEKSLQAETHCSTDCGLSGQHCAEAYEIVKVPERILSRGVPVIEPPSCAVRFPPFSPLRSGSGCSRIPEPARIALCKPCGKQKKLHVCVQLSDKNFCFNIRVRRKLHIAKNPLAA